MSISLDLAYYITKLLNFKGIGPAKVNAMFCDVADETIVHNIKNSAFNESLFSKFINPDQFNELRKDDLDLVAQFNKLNAVGCDFVTIKSKSYPRQIMRQMGNSAPPVLFYKGNLKLLKKVAVGFCGSRKASDVGRIIARDCAKQLVDSSFITISGYASGIDQEIHHSTLKNDGSTIIVLPEGILNFKIKKILENVWDWDKVLVISQFTPSKRWTSYNAMTRNKTIVSLSSLMVLIESKEKGGSMDAGLAALKFNKKLYTPIYEDMPDFATGNQVLLKKGAFPITAHKNSTRPDLTMLFKELNAQSKKKCSLPTNHQPLLKFLSDGA